MFASPEQPSPHAAFDCVASGGEMAALMRSIDWAQTALGPIDGWPQSLRTTVSICLSSRFPMVILWGPELVMLYNDAYRPMLGATKHPRAMGYPGRQVWPEVWPIIGPMLEGVLARSEATWADDQLMLLDRNGFLEECYFTFSYSPIRDESDSVGGVFCAVNEMSGRVLNERRLQTLRALAEQATQAKTAEEACALAARVLAGNPYDLPFALLYLLDDEGSRARLVKTVNLAPGTPASPAVVGMDGEDDLWSLGRVLDTRKSQTVEGLEGTLGRLPAGPWADDWTKQVLVLPLAKAGAQELPAGFLVAGISPRLPFDDDYRGFLDLVASQIATAVANARAAELREASHLEQELRAEVQAAKERLEVALAGARAGVWQLDLLTHQVIWSPELYDLLGQSREEFDPSSRRFIELIHPDDRERNQAEFAEALARGGQFEMEFRIIRPDGVEIWVSSVGRIECNAEGKPVLAIGINQDITARRLAEQQGEEARRTMELALAIAQAGVWEWDVVADRVTGDENLARLFALPAAELLAGTMSTEEFFQVIEEEDRAQIHQCLQDVYAAGGEFEVEYRLARTEGAAKWLATRGRVELGAGGKVERATGLSFDITQRRQMEDALKQADRRKDEFLAMLAHELRNPLAPIRNAAEVLKLVGPADGHQQWAREVIERQTQHLTRLVDDLLDVSRITQGKIKIACEPLDLAAIVQRAVEASRPLIEARRHQLTVVLPPEPVRLQGDLTRLVQVIGNLLNNAAKYTEEGGRIHLEAGREGEEAVVRVRDNGMGLPADLLPHIFDLFIQADRSLDRSQGGLGIGLTLVRQLVELHGGRVEARSGGFGQGSEFAVWLPAPPALAEAGAETALGEPAQPASRTMKILVVEDHVDSAEMMSFLLELGGHQVRTAHDGLEALEAAGAFLPHVVLCDIGLPGMSGYEVAARLRQQPAFQQTPLIALTGYGQEEVRSRAREAGFDHHLVKPVEPGVLDALLKSLRTEGGRGRSTSAVE